MCIRDRITGKDYNVFGLVGDTTKIDERDVLANPWIDNVSRVSAPYKRANQMCIRDSGTLAHKAQHHEHRAKVRAVRKVDVHPVQR